MKPAEPDGAELGGVLTGVGTATGGLVVGAETLPGKVLILLSPVTTVAIDYLGRWARHHVARWDDERPLREARRALRKAIDDPRISEEQRARFAARLEDLQEAEIEAKLRALSETRWPSEPRDPDDDPSPAGVS